MAALHSVTCVESSEDGRFLAIGCSSGALLVYDLQHPSHTVFQARPRASRRTSVGERLIAAQDAIAATLASGASAADPQAALAEVRGRIKAQATPPVLVRATRPKKQKKGKEVCRRVAAAPHAPLRRPPHRALSTLSLTPPSPWRGPRTCVRCWWCDATAALSGWGWRRTPRSYRSRM